MYRCRINIRYYGGCYSGGTKRDRAHAISFRATVRSFSPKCVIVIGKINTLNAKQQKAFELYRNSFNNLTIITFDELHQKICDLISVFKEDTPRPDDPLMDEFSIIDEDYPF